MKKQHRAIQKTGFKIDEWSRTTYPLPDLPEFVFSKHIRRRANDVSKKGTAVIDLKNGWYLHSYRNGTRVLSVLPF